MVTLRTRTQVDLVASENIDGDTQRTTRDMRT